MNLLIVDDERFAVEGIRNCNDWPALGIDTVLTARSADEAKAVMREHRIDILICDIEMPDEDGLSLVGWVKEHAGHTETVFLTCHSEFAYAKQAIQLGSFEYLLKPVDAEELAQVVKRMVEVIRDKSEQQRLNEMYHHYYELWKKQRPLMEERFWQEMLSRSILPFGDFLERALQNAQIGLPQEQPVLPVLISIEEWRKPLQSRDQDIMEYAVKKAAEEVWLAGCEGQVFFDKNGILFVVLYATDGEREWHDFGRNAGERFIALCEDYFFCQVSCYMGGLTPLHDVAHACDELREMERNNVTRSKTVLQVNAKAVSPAPAVNAPVPMNVTEWSGYLLNGKRDKVIERIRQLVHGLKSSGDVQLKQIETYFHELLQVIYHFLCVKGISVHQVPNFATWSTVHIRSLAQLENWAVNVVSAVMDTANADVETGGFVQQSIHFMKANVEECISREDVAAHVKLNPAYLSRLFKKETGKNLVDYLIETKVDRGKQLLETTSMTVSAIAQQVGYSNFSHFTKMFKKRYGVNPQDYRQHRFESR